MIRPALRDPSPDDTINRADLDRVLAGVDALARLFRPADRPGTAPKAIDPGCEFCPAIGGGCIVCRPTAKPRKHGPTVNELWMFDTKLFVVRGFEPSGRVRFGFLDDLTPLPAEQRPAVIQYHRFHPERPRGEFDLSPMGMAGFGGRCVGKWAGRVTAGKR